MFTRPPEDHKKKQRQRSKNGGCGGAVCAHVMHDRSRMIRPSHPHNAGTENVGFSPTRQALLAPSSKRREVFGESHEW